jgi:hypothetical protein
MGLAIDGSSPAVFTSAVANAVSASFTPPVGSLLVAAFAGNSTGGVNPASPTITDSRGVPLTYTQQVWRSRVDGSPVVDGHCAIWTAPVTSSASMTVTITSGGGSLEKACRVWVITGQHPVNPIGLVGKAASASASSIAQNYTALHSLGQGFMCVLDWSALGNMTAGAGNTLDGTGSVGAGQISYGFGRRTLADDAMGVTNILRVNPNGTSTALNWCWVEILEAPSLVVDRPLPQWFIQQLIASRQTYYPGEVTSGPQTIILGQASESSTAQAITARKTLLTGQATETSTAQTLTSKKLKGLGQITETSTAQTVTWKRQRLISQVTETSTAQAITRRKSLVISQITETSTAQPITKLKVKVIGQVTETSTAQAIARRKVQTVNQITETNTAQSVTRRKTIAVGKITETSTSQAVAHSKLVAIGQASESDTSNSVTSPGAPVIVGTVTESSTAQSVSVRKIKVISQIVETSTTGAVARLKTKLVSQASESDQSQVIVRFNVPLVIRVNESNLARQVTGGTATGDTHGWRPLLGLHCVYLLQKTFGGSSQYIKRISVKIIGFATDGYPILKSKQSGVTYGTASVGVRPRSHPDADEFDVYVSY